MINTETTFPQILFFPLRELKMNLFQDAQNPYKRSNNQSPIQAEQRFNTLISESTHECSSLVRLQDRNTEPRTESLILNVGVVENHVSLCLKASR